MGSKYLDIILAVFLAFFAYTRFANDQVGMGILFVILCLMNIFTGILKHKKAGEKKSA